LRVGTACYTRSMVRWPRFHRLWLLVATLALLLGVLAVLQYRWVGEIGRGERQRLQDALNLSARRFAAALDREVVGVFLAFRFEPGDPEVTRDARVLRRLAAWQAKSEHPGLVSGVTLVLRDVPRGLTVEDCERGESGCHESSLPAELEFVRRALMAQGGERRGPGSFPGRPSALHENPLSLLVPIVAVERESDRAPRLGGPFRIDGVAVVRLDAPYVRSQLLPQLAETYFGPLDQSAFSVAVVRREDGTVLYSSEPGLHPDALQPGDVELPLFDLPWRGSPGAGRFERGVGRDRPRVPRDPRRVWSREDPAARGFAEWGRSPGPNDPPAGADGPRGPRLAETSPWVLVVKHRGGSLDQAVAAARRRNLAVGLGVLLLLGTAGVLLATGAQRARDLARQQLEFVAGVTHELHTPLAAVRSAGQNLADGIVTDPAQVRRYGALIQKEGSRLSDLVAQVLDFAGIESAGRAYVFEPVGLAPLVERVVLDLALVFEQGGLRLETHVPPDLPRVRADAGALRRVLENLLTNAVKFAAAGGWVGIDATPRPDRRAVVLRVQDRGPGIPRHERDLVFEPFFRGSSAEACRAPGSGLGLSFVRHVVLAHGGRVRVLAHEEGGTLVVVELPVAAPEEGIEGSAT
jgi:signal transduction histidine kinase